MNTELFLAFIAATAVICTIPGPNITLIVATAATKGIRAGLMVVLGTTVAQVIQIAMVIEGLAWLVSAYGFAFDLLRIAGAGYLVYLGIKTWLTAHHPEGEATHRRSVTRGFWVGLANPKSLALLAVFIPQFIDPTLPANFQFMVLAFTYLSIAVVFDTLYAVSAGYGGRAIYSNRVKFYTSRLSGLILAGGGLWLASLQKNG
ncbi:LysE family translocator [Amphritea pacifica]|uniref:LysE family translocator n=1 Tax=Amphritea pacifica TaxID=2811233 RepID=A0ABS2WD59_9GAMM|nr:LysE family translocator [Amphritea pacifica]MBN0989660.1 LysE family translocator [Amphritea pacifica]MBN1006575.1 LysE family translocator [Amphritea pacifica]